MRLRPLMFPVHAFHREELPRPSIEETEEIEEEEIEEEADDASQEASAAAWAGGQIRTRADYDAAVQLAGGPQHHILADMLRERGQGSHHITRPRPIHLCFLQSYRQYNREYKTHKKLWGEISAVEELFKGLETRYSNHRSRTRRSHAGLTISSAPTGYVRQSTAARSMCKSRARSAQNIRPTQRWGVGGGGVGAN